MEGGSRRLKRIRSPSGLSVGGAFVAVEELGFSEEAGLGAAGTREGAIVVSM